MSHDTNQRIQHQTRPLVSVIIPAYNAATFLVRAVTSCSDSPYHHTEIVIVDDGSADNTPVLADQLATIDARISVIHQENRGLAEARNIGICHATGKYIVLLDADDELALDWLSVACSVLEHNLGIDGVYGDWSIYRARAKDGEYGTLHAPLSLDTLLSDNVMPVNALMLRHALYQKIGHFDKALPTHEDWQYWLRAANAGWRMKHITQLAGIVHAHGGNMSGNWRRMSAGRIACLMYADTRFHLTSRQQRILNGRRAVERFFATLEDVYDDGSGHQPASVTNHLLLKALAELPWTYSRSLSAAKIYIGILLILSAGCEYVKRPELINLPRLLSPIRCWSHLAPTAQHELGYA